LNAAAHTSGFAGEIMNPPTPEQMKTLEVLIHGTELDPAKWLNFPDYGLRQYFLWKNPDNGASVAIIEFDKGGRIPTKHTHASNQFMYCLQGDYEYIDTGLRLKPGSFYMNPKDHPHGPTIAHEKSVLIEIYDGPHYYEKPDFHTDETISGVLAKQG
jgi:2,4'-dihydroxyacetophenone dioxygenase